MNWLKEAEQICATREKADIEQMLAFGKLVKKMVDSGEYKGPTKAGIYLASELSKKGPTFPCRFMEKCHLLATRFTPILHRRMVDLAMPKDIALLACHWQMPIMEERLDIAASCGWRRIREKYIMAKRSVNRRPRSKPRAPAVPQDPFKDASGEWNHDSIIDWLRHLMTCLENKFDEDLAVARQMVGRKVA